MAAIDAKIDELYQLPLAEFTAARNALAKSLSGADAARVKRQEKPTVVPWAVNQLYWRARPVYDRLMKSGDMLRAAQIAALEGRKADVRQASDAHRKALAEAVARASDLARAGGSQPGAEPLARMLEAISLAVEQAAHPGRFTDIIQPAGFEAITGVALAAPKRGGEPGPPREAGSRRRESQRGGGAAVQVVDQRQLARQLAIKQREEARRAAAKEKRVKAAEQALERARAAEAKAREALDRAERERREAEQLLSQLRRGPAPGASLR